MSWSGAGSTLDRQIAGSPDAALARHRLALCDSYRRAGELLLAMLRARSPREQVSLFLEWGNACDAPFGYRSEFAHVLRQALKKAPLRKMLGAPERAWLDSMDPLIRIHRGCEAGRVRGPSWTTDIGVARKFAAGQRCVNAHPTLASAVIPRQHVLGLFLDRGEREVIVDPAGCVGSRLGRWKNGTAGNISSVPRRTRRPEKDRSKVEGRLSPEPAARPAR